MIKEHNKLVRDNIPNIIRAKGETPTVKILVTEEFKKQLNKKLTEEVNEYLESEDVMELADIVEVVHGILNQKGVSWRKFEKLRKAKAKKNGGFYQGIYLESVESAEPEEQKEEDQQTEEVKPEEENN